MNHFRGIPGLLRPNSEQPAGDRTSAGGALLALNPAGPGNSSSPFGSAASVGGSGFLTHLQSHQQYGLQNPAAQPHNQQPGSSERLAPPSDRRETESIAAAHRERDAQAVDRDAGRAAKNDRRRDDAASDASGRNSEKAATESDNKSEANAQAQSTERSDATKAGEKSEENARTKEAQRAGEKRAVDGEEPALRSEAQRAGGESPLDAAVAELSANLKSVLLSKGEAKGDGEGASKLKDGTGAKTGADLAKAQAGDGQKTQPADGAEAVELKKFAERVAAAKADLKQATAGEKADQRADASASNNSGGGKEAAKVDAVSGGLRVELDSAKWQLNGRVYGERGGQENIESKVAGLMDRYVKGRGANAKDPGSQNRNESGGEQQRGDARNFANRLSDLQLAGTGDVRDANQSQSLDQARMQKMDQAELARENRRLFNELVEKARVNVQSNGSSTASIKMNPAALGRMTLNLEVHQNQVHARILVDSDAAKRVLMDEMDHLRQELGRQGITVESLSIRVREAANMSFMQNSDGTEHSALDQQAAGGDEQNGDDGATNGEARQSGDEQSLRSSGDEASRQYDRDAGALAAESASRRELSAVNISI